jgi:hypothetical protein
MEVEVCLILLVSSAFIIWPETWLFSNYALMLRSGVLAIAKESGATVSGCLRLSTTTKVHGRYCTITSSRPYNYMKVRFDEV